MIKEIRVNSLSEKMAAKTLKKGLAVFGLTIEDLVNFKDTIYELNALKSENRELKNALGIPTEGAIQKGKIDEIDGKPIAEWVAPQQTIHVRETK